MSPTGVSSTAPGALITPALRQRASVSSTRSEPKSWFESAALCPLPWARGGAHSTMKSYEFILGVLAVWRLTHLLSDGDGPFDWCAPVRRRGGGGGGCFFLPGVGGGAPGGGASCLAGP